MNRLVLIGNGFDLAHGLKTKYEHFIDWYWEAWGNRLMVEKKYKEEDEFCLFELRDKFGIGNWYLVRDWRFQDMNMGAMEFIRRVKMDTNLCFFKYKSPFFEQINEQRVLMRWVDIENEYYKMLVNTKSFGDGYQHLNEQLKCLREKLIEYLIQESEKESATIESIKEKLYRPIERRDVVLSMRHISEDNLKLSNIMLLNFNYTSTPELYKDAHSNVTINYIHGRLNNPNSVIFGYGDELDKEFSRLKELNDNECLRYVKSINYLEADNYRKLLEFIETEPFQVIIMGHSCGNSDRTLLNTIFEHPNCVSIKPYYYINEKGEDNYLELVQNIYRNFTDLRQMRDRVVNKTYTEPLCTPTKQLD